MLGQMGQGALPEHGIQGEQHHLVKPPSRLGRIPQLPVALRLAQKKAGSFHVGRRLALPKFKKRAFGVVLAMILVVVVPATINGAPIAICFDRLARVLCKYGSPGLQVDIVYLIPLLPRVGGLSFPEVLATLHKA